MFTCVSVFVPAAQKVSNPRRLFSTHEQTSTINLANIVLITIATNLTSKFQDTHANCECKTIYASKKPWITEPNTLLYSEYIIISSNKMKNSSQLQIA